MKGEKQGKGLDIEDFLNYSSSISATLREPFLVLNRKLRAVSAYIADIYQALISGRPYRKAYSKKLPVPDLILTS
jgi:hypothetical protein